MNKKKIIIISLIVVLLIGGGFFLWREISKPIDNQKLTLKQASRMGEIATHKLLVQIERPKGSPEILKGRYERGDIVLVASEDNKFSESEKTGFLILKMELTPKQVEILTLSLVKESGKKDERGRVKDVMLFFRRCI